MYEKITMFVSQSDAGLSHLA